MLYLLKAKRKFGLLVVLPTRGLQYIWHTVSHVGLPLTVHLAYCKPCRCVLLLQACV